MCKVLLQENLTQLPLALALRWPGRTGTLNTVVLKPINGVE
jgi:hypothetical protein